MGKHAALVHAIVMNAIEQGLIENTSHEYFERGYSDPSKLILFANWNPTSFGEWDRETGKRIQGTSKESFCSRLAALIDKCKLNDEEYALEWCDEWSTCHECNRAVRTQPNSYSWKPQFLILNECNLLCVECAANDMDNVEEHFKNNCHIADTFGFDWESRGWVTRDEIYESGFHPGQNDDPAKIAKEIEDQGEHDYLFVVGRVRQFDMEFEVLLRPKGYEVD